MKDPTAERRSPGTCQALLLCLALAVVTVAVYWPVRLNEFVNYDDGEYLTSNPHLQSGLNWTLVRWAFTSGYAANWHPLTWLSHALDVQVFGLNPAGHHLVNLGIHTLNTLLLFLFLFRTTGAPWRSSLVAALFALHPLHVESVAWASERKDVLSTCFGLLALLSYGEYVLSAEGRGPAREAGAVPVQANRTSSTSTPRSPRRQKSADHTPPDCAFRIPHSALWYLLTLLLFGCSLLSKPMLVTFPFLLLLLDFWPIRRLSLENQKSTFNHLLSLLPEKLPFLLLSAASSLVTLSVQHGAMAFYRGLPFGQRAANAAVACVRYLGKTVWPHNLSVFYPHPEHLPASQTIAAALFLLLVCCAALAAWRRRPAITVGWFWFLGTLIPVLGLVQVGMQAMADRYTYFPLMGVFILGVWTVAHWLGRAHAPRWLAAAAASLLLLACVLSTRAQLAVWHNSETLFSHAAAVTPDNWVAHENLAFSLLGQYQSAEHQAVENQVVRLQSVPTRPRDSLQGVVRHCEAALELRPRNVNARLALAQALIELNELNAALPQLQIVLRLSPTNAVAHQNLADLSYRQHRPQEAIAQYQAALAQTPDWPAVLNNLAWLLATHPQAELRDGPQALQLAERACVLSGHTNLWYLHTLAAAYAETGQFSEAIAAADQARRLAAATGQTGLVATAEHRLQLYQAHSPLRDP